MSGRWRSRHYRDDENGPPRTTGDSIGNPRSAWDGKEAANHVSGDYGSRNNVEMEQHGNNHHDGQNTIPARKGNDHGHSKSNNYHRPSSSHNPQRRWADMEDDDDEKEVGDGEWRRAQPLPAVTPPSNSMTARRGIHPNRQTSAVASTPKANGSVRAAFPPAPARAWGHPSKMSSSVHTDGNPSRILKKETAAPEKKSWGNDVNDTSKIEIRNGAEKLEQKLPGSRIVTPANPATKKKPNAWSKPDPSNLASPDTAASHEQKIKAQSDKGILPGNWAKSKNSKNPWATPDTTDSVNAAVRSGNSLFPSLSDAGDDAPRSQKYVGKEVAGAEQHSATMNQKSTTPISNGLSWGKSQLPASAGWGMSSSSKPTLQSSAKQQTTNNNNSKVNEFPLLSSALSAPRNPRHTTLTTSHAPSTTAEPSKNNAKGTKKGPTASSLASFLTPQIQSGNNKKTQSTKQPTSSTAKKVASAAKKSSVLTSTPKANIGGVKRSAPSSSYSSSIAPSSDKSPYHPAIHTINNGNKDTSSHLKKGRQRIAPRKKKLTTLKKRVLEERLRVWKELHPEEDEAVGVGKDVPSTKRVKRNESSSESIDGNVALLPTSQEISEAESKSTTLFIENFIQPEEDDLEDEDEYDEIVSNLISLAGRVGKVLNIFIPRPSEKGCDEDDIEEGVINQERKWVGYSFVRFETNKDLRAAKDIFDGMIIGGQQLRPSVLQLEEIDSCSRRENQDETNIIPSAENERQWQQAVMMAMENRVGVSNKVPTPESQIKQSEEVASSTANTVVFHKILCDDDYDDDEALEESIEDIKGLAMQYGPVSDATGVVTGSEKGNIYVTFNELDAARKAIEELNGMVVGGSKITVSLHDACLQNSKPIGPVEVILNNVLNENDFEDEDCLNESIEDISNLARKYGQVGKVYAETSGDQSGMVHIEYMDGITAAQQAVKGLDGMVIGGLIVSATISNDSTSKHSTESSHSPTSGTQAQTEEGPPEPMLSGDKIIPERFAACKRVPKIPNPGVPRAYASKLNDERATPILIEMLGELMRLQERNKGDKNARARRRLVMGLREVARGIRARKVKMVVMANNLDEYGAIDSKLQEILDMARAEDVPVIFELNKRKLGKALGKSIKVSVVGVQNSDGAQEQFKKLRKIMGLI